MVTGSDHQTHQVPSGITYRAFVGVTNGRRENDFILIGKPGQVCRDARSASSGRLLNHNFSTQPSVTEVLTDAVNQGGMAEACNPRVERREGSR